MYHILSYRSPDHRIGIYRFRLNSSVNRVWGISEWSAASFRTKVCFCVSKKHHFKHTFCFGSSVQLRLTDEVPMHICWSLLHRKENKSWRHTSTINAQKVNLKLWVRALLLILIFFFLPLLKRILLIRISWRNSLAALGSGERCVHNVQHVA